jgi:uncharacterized protein (DUF433 family)
MIERISLNPDICHGQACIKGTRIPVYQIVALLANGDTVEGLLKIYPTITREDIDACSEWAVFEAAVKEYLPPHKDTR